jgi:hypothetical protein
MPALRSETPLREVELLHRAGPIKAAANELAHHNISDTQAR